VTKPDWVEKELVRVLLQLDMNGDPELNDRGVPTLADVATSDDDRQIFNLVFGSALMARPFTAPPGVSEDVLQTLRTAFAETAKDPDFLAEAEKQGLSIDFVSADQVQELVEGAYASSPELVERARNAYTGQ